MKRGAKKFEMFVFSLCFDDHACRSGSRMQILTSQKQVRKDEPCAKHVGFCSAPCLAKTALVRIPKRLFG